jgi:hypothetical protein
LGWLRMRLKWTGPERKRHESDHNQICRGAKPCYVVIAIE